MIAFALSRDMQEPTRVGDALSKVDWTRFTGRQAPAEDPDVARQVRGKRLLVTGAGGFLGSLLARRLAALQPARLLLLDQAEAGLANLQRTMGADDFRCEVEFVVGDVRDRAALRDLLGRDRVDVVFHAAACKYVPLLETNPVAAASVNVLGTATLLRAAREAGVERFVFLSTDKAVAPVSVLGVTKRIAELVVLGGATDAPSVQVLRLCNVLGSTGGVASVFAEQIRDGESLTLTDREASRYFITPAEAVGALVRVGFIEAEASLWVPRMAEQHSIAELARFLARTLQPTAQLTTRTMGMRAGDKRTEALWSAQETPAASPIAGLWTVRTPVVSEKDLAAGLALVAAAVAENRPAAVLGALGSLVPEYQPSAVARNAAGSREGVPA